MNAMDDGILLDRWRVFRDGSAFAELARRHSSLVFDVTIRMLGNRAMAEDILQEALLDLAVQPTRKPVEVGVAAWLIRFALRSAGHRRVSERSRSRREALVARDRAESSPLPDDALVRSDEIDWALRGCAAEDRALLTMRYLHGWDCDRIAAAMSLRTGAVRVRLHRALQVVRAKCIGRRGALGMAAASPLSLEASIRNAMAAAAAQLDERFPRAEPRHPSARRLAAISFLAVAFVACVVAVPGGAGSDLPDSLAPSGRDASCIPVDGSVARASIPSPALAGSECRLAVARLLPREPVPPVAASTR